MPAELFRALAAFVEPPNRATERLTSLLGIGEPPTAAEHTDLFTLNLYPYASVYLGPEGMLGGEGRDRIAGFWRALGETPPVEPDHLALMLAQYAALSELADDGEDVPARREAAARARDTFLREHLLSWLPPWLDKLADLAPPSYAPWGRLLGEALEQEARRLDAAIVRGAPPASLRDEPHERAGHSSGTGAELGVDDLLSTLLAPARSGMILVRADLARAARTLGLGLRIGERRFVLRALLSQEPGAVAEWVGAEAATWAARHAARRDWLGSIAEAWERKARATERLAGALAASARDERP